MHVSMVELSLSDLCFSYQELPKWDPELSAETVRGEDCLLVQRNNEDLKAARAAEKLRKQEVFFAPITLSHRSHSLVG
jgi:hypothetical protein